MGLWLNADVYLSCWIGGGAIALAVAWWLAQREGLPPFRLVMGVLGLGLFFCLGARAHALLLEEARPLSVLLEAPRVWFSWGMRLPGGILLAAAAAPLIARWMVLPYWRFSDLAAVDAALFLALGRIGCHFAGCCFGIPAALPWAVTYGPGSVAYALHVQRGLITANAPSSLPVHPFALYCSLAAAAIFVFLLRLGSRPGLRDGMRMLAGLTLCGIAFGVLEGVRDGGSGGAALYRQEMWFAFALVAGPIWLVRSGVLSVLITPRSRLPNGGSRQRPLVGPSHG